VAEEDYHAVAGMMKMLLACQMTLIVLIDWLVDKLEANVA